VWGLFWWHIIQISLNYLIGLYSHGPAIYEDSFFLFIFTNALALPIFDAIRSDIGGFEFFRGFPQL
jgi:hypothetical protein